MFIDEQTDFWVSDWARIHTVPVEGLFDALLKSFIQAEEYQHL